MAPSNILGHAGAAVTDTKPNRDTTIHDRRWGPPLRSPGAFPDPETSREIARERLAASRTAQKRMFAIYVVLIAVTTAFGVVAAYHWERGKDVAATAATIAAQNDALVARVTELESLSDGLADIVALAFAEAPQELLAELNDLEERRPEAADTTTFAKLWIGAKDRETQAQTASQPGFETASGGAPTTPDVAKSDSVKPDAAKAEPAPQDHAKSDVAKGDPAPSGQVRPEPTSDTPAQTDTQVARVERSDASRQNFGQNLGQNLRQSDIAIRAIAESWIQIVDGSGKPMFTKLLKDGDVHTLSSTQGAMLITGNPTGLDVTVGGVPAPPFNAKGPTRREIALDPARLLGGTAEEPPKRPVPATPAPN
jgi:hypothetical protein